MEPLKKRVAVVMQRRPIVNRWQSEVWEPWGVLADYDGALEPRILLERDGVTQWLFPGFDLLLRRSEAEGYFHNVSTPEPRVFILWRMEEGRAVPQFAT